MGGGNMMGALGGGSKVSTAGGISPEQQALAQYTFGEANIGDRQTFAQAGMGPSTSESVAIGGHRFGEAKQAAEMSDADYKAMVAYQQQQQNSLASIAGQAGQILGGGGGGGTQSG